MSPVKKTNQQAPGVRTFGAIDIGSNSIRMAIAQTLENGRIEVLERLQRGVRLGQDRIVGVGRRGIEDVHLAGSEQDRSATFLDNLCQQHLERRQDARDTRVQIAAVHAQVVDADQLITAVPAEWLLWYRT